MKATSVVPYLWFDNQAVEAVNFYTSIFPNSDYIAKNVIEDTPSGDCDELAFTIDGQEFFALNGGPYFKFNPSISYILSFDATRFDDPISSLKDLWKKLSEDGKILMPLDKYDFSDLYGWTEDKYGVSWQLILSSPSGDMRPFVTPSLLFCDEVFGRAEEARSFYTELFEDSELGSTYRYEYSENEDEKDKLMFADFRIANLWLACSDSSYNHGFTFNEAVSFLLLCDSQEEVDFYWSKLSSFPESEQCGWCKDKFGVSWQIVPRTFNELMEKGNRKQIQEVSKLMLDMKKLQIEPLEKAYIENKAKRSYISADVKADINKVWDYWNQPEHIKNWSFASDDWYVSHASNDLRVDGKLVTGMSAKDGSAAFDFTGTYNKVDKHKSIIFTLDDDRKVIVNFEEINNGVRIHEYFDNDLEFDEEFQKQGWQAILNNFKSYVERS